MIRVLLVILASSLALLVSGCANRVAPPVQQHYLVVSATMAGNVDIANVRYFVFLKYNASSTAGPNLLSPNQYNHVLSIASATTSAQCIDFANPGVAGGLGAVNSDFQFDEFYERSSILGTTSGTFANVNSSNNPAVIVTINATNIQFSIPLNTVSSPIGINVVTANATNYLIQDYLASGTSNSGYHLFTNIVGNSYSNTVISTPIVLPAADIISWSASII